MEYRDIYDVNRIKTGRTALRGAPLGADDFVLVVHVCLFNDAGQMLIQQRQSNKNKWPNMWDVSVAGAAMAGDSSQTAARREALEEIGLDLADAIERPALTINFSFGFDDFYIVNRSVDCSALILQEAEVKAVRWASRDEVLQLCDRGQFIPYRRNFIKLLFDMAKGSSDIIRTC